MLQLEETPQSLNIKGIHLARIKKRNRNKINELAASDMSDLDLPLEDEKRRWQGATHFLSEGHSLVYDPLNLEIVDDILKCDHSDDSS